MSNASAQLGDFIHTHAPTFPQMADFQCPITAMVMDDPVTAPDGFNYERSAIEQWVLVNKNSPQTTKAMDGEFVGNNSLKEAIVRVTGIATGNTTSGDISWPPHGEQSKETQRSLDAAALSSAAARHSPAADMEQTSLSQALSKAFKELDPLRELSTSVLGGLVPPKFVVLGNESSGKSTVVEALSAMPVFPRKKRFCTKVAVHLRLRRADKAKATITVFGLSESGIETKMGESEDLPQENGWLWVQNKMEDLARQLVGSSAAGIVHDKIIVVEVQRRDVPSIDLVDTPGLAMMPEAKKNAVEKVLEAHLQHDRQTGGHSMYLAVIPAGGDARPNTNMAMKFVQDNNLQQKTIGVLTKCDQASDKEILCALITGDPTSEGDTMDDLGGIALEKGWAATMLKPPTSPVYQVHNFERLRIQQREEKNFFAADEFQSLRTKSLAGIEALVIRLEREYSSYLRTTWKEGAMQKVLKKLAEREFDLKMVGVLPETTKRDVLARKEIQRRMGPDSPMKDLYKAFIRDVLYHNLRMRLQSQMKDFQNMVLPGGEVDKKLQDIKERVMRFLEESVAKVAPPPELHKILTARCECKAQSDGQTQGNGPSTAMYNIVTEVVGVASLVLWGEFKPMDTVMRELKQQPFIQLSEYKEFTDQVMTNCISMYAKAQEILRKDARDFTERLVNPDSPWLTIRPRFCYADDDDDAAKSSDEVKLEFAVDDFICAIGTQFLRSVPSVEDLQKAHEGVPVGKEHEEALKNYQSIRDEINMIERARDGIRRALDIGDQEMEQMQREIDSGSGQTAATTIDQID